MFALDEADVARQDAMVFAWVPYPGRMADQGGLLGATFSWEFVGNESKGGGFCQHCAEPRPGGVKMVSLVLRVILESRIGRLTACASWKEDSDG